MFNPTSWRGVGGVRFTTGPNLANTHKLDRLPIPMLERMTRRGFAVDRDHFHSLAADFDAEITKFDERIGEYVDPMKLDSFNADSPEQVAHVLFDILKVGAGRRLKVTANTGRVSTGKKQMELLKSQHPLIQLVLDRKGMQKLKSTYAEALPLRARRHAKGWCAACCERHKYETWRIHTEFGTTRTDTSRFNSKNPNLQNIPKRTELGKKIRQGFIASPGCKLTSNDFSQIELRLLAHCANESKMIGIFERDLDIHTATAADVFGVEYGDVDKFTQRMPCKNVNFMIVYGATEVGLQGQLALSGLMWDDAQCKQFIEDWFDNYSGVRGYMDWITSCATTYGFVWDEFGGVRMTPEVRSTLPRVRAAGVRQAGNMPVQATAAGLMKLSMGEIEDRHAMYMDRDDTTSSFWKPLSTIHDQLIGECPEDVADDWLTKVNTAMVECVELRVPVKVDGELADRWDEGGE